jgi:hypothetical protein
MIEVISDLNWSGAYHLFGIMIVSFILVLMR